MAEQSAVGEPLWASLTNTVDNCFIGNNWWTPSTGDTWCTYTYPQPRKIRLTLSEVEALRAAAKKDKALREALEKFGPHIEVEVDFPGGDEDEPLLDIDLGPDDL